MGTKKARSCFLKKSTKKRLQVWTEATRKLRSIVGCSALWHCTNFPHVRCGAMPQRIAPYGVNAFGNGRSQDRQKFFAAFFQKRSPVFL
jgi:hypothetical protein